MRPASARWIERGASHLAVLDYDDARATDDPRAAVLAFLQSAYRAGDARTGWNLARHDCDGGATDPYARMDISGS